MSYIQKNLLPDEQILFKTNKSLIIFVGPICLTLLTLYFFLNINPYVQKAALIFALATSLIWIKQILMYIVSEFAVTNLRVMMREGFFIRHTNDTRMAALANVTVNQSLVGQALHYGTILIHSFGGESDPFRNIHQPLEFQKTLQAQLYKLKKPII
jgi:uncharacterized membrane protein YdbT with pleckstrin-like domain